MKVNIVACETINVAVLEHHGAPALLNDSVKIFIDWRKQSGLSPVTSANTYGIAYNNPETTPPQAFRFDVCGTVTQAVPANVQGVINKQIPAGRCAVLRHFGSHERIAGSIRYLCGDWLPHSGEASGDFPLYLHYLNLPPDTAEHDLLTDIYLPLQNKKTA